MNQYVKMMLAHNIQTILFRYLAPVILVLSGTFSIIGCGGGGGDSGGIPPGEPTNLDVKVSWEQNRETAVNSLGGGYRVYYSTTENFNITNADVVDVLYVSGPATPTSIIISLSSGTYYFKVVAYSNLNPSGSGPSRETSVSVPFL